MAMLEELMQTVEVPTLALAAVALTLTGLVLVWLILRAVKNGPKPNDLDLKQGKGKRYGGAAAKPQRPNNQPPAGQAKPAAGQMLAQTRAVAVAGLKLPEDSVLKRHAIGQLTAQIQAELVPRPSDSVLRRHYDALLQNELAKRLAG